MLDQETNKSPWQSKKQYSLSIQDVILTREQDALVLQCDVWLLAKFSAKSQSFGT